MSLLPVPCSARLHDSIESSTYVSPEYPWLMVVTADMDFPSTRRRTRSPLSMLLKAFQQTQTVGAQPRPWSNSSRRLQRATRRTRKNFVVGIFVVLRGCRSNVWCDSHRRED